MGKKEDETLSEQLPRSHVRKTLRRENVSRVINAAERNEILIAVFGKMEFIGDLDNSNCSSIMGTKPVWSEWKSGDRERKVQNEEHT